MSDGSEQPSFLVFCADTGQNHWVSGPEICTFYSKRLPYQPQNRLGPLWATFSMAHLQSHVPWSMYADQHFVLSNSPILKTIFFYSLSALGAIVFESLVDYCGLLFKLTSCFRLGRTEPFGVFELVLITLFLFAILKISGCGSRAGHNLFVGCFFFSFFLGYIGLLGLRAMLTWWSKDLSLCPCVKLGCQVANTLNHECVGKIWVHIWLHHWSIS